MAKTLGPLCSRNHNHEGTGQSLRYKNGVCIECQREREAKKNKKYQLAQARMALAQKDQELTELTQEDQKPKVQDSYYVVIVNNSPISTQVEEKAKSMAGELISAIEKQPGRNAVGVFSFASPIAAAKFSRKMSCQFAAVSNPVLNPNRVNIFDMF